MLSQADEKLTRRDILSAWPTEAARPDDTTLWRWLGRAADLGLLCQEGERNKKNAPFRYWLPAKGTEWAKDPMRQFLEEAERNSQRVLEGLRVGKVG